jgi:tRNA-dihydrouridine synthase B
VRESLKIQVIANGGVFSKESYDTLRKDTGCTVVMVARGAMGNPWIFNELKGNIDGLIGTDEFIDEMHKHISDVVLYHGEKFGMKFARKIILDYLKGRGYGGELKSRASKISTLDEFEIYLDEIRKGPSESFVKQYAIWRMGRGVHS